MPGEVRLFVISSYIYTRVQGAMKTYWLEDRESRPSLTKMISSQLQPGNELEWERAADVRDSIAEYSAQQLNNKENSVYYPPSNTAPNSLNNSAGNPLAIVPSAPRSQPTVMSPAEERRMYSPVTFQDVARRSIANSPNRVEKEKGDFLEQYQSGSRQPSYNTTIKGIFPHFS